MKYLLKIQNSKFKIVIVIAITGIVFLFAYAPIKAATLKIIYDLRYTDGLVGYWSFNGPDMDFSLNRATDRSGNSNHGTLISMSTTTSPAPGKIGQGLNFDGVDDDVVVPRSASLEPSTAITVEAWVKPDTGYGDTYPRIMDKSAGGENRGYYFLITASNGIITWSVDLSVSGDTAITSNAVVSVNQWSHLVGTYDGSAMRIYINGVLDKEQTGLSGTIDQATAKDLIIGDDSSTANDRNFDGIIDEVRVYSRALSASEILEHYLAGVGR